MSLAEAEPRRARATEIPQAANSCTVKWDSWPASTLSHHGRACCDMAKEWVLATDYSQLGDASAQTGPRWLRQRYPWGPSKWPLHWCEAVEAKQLDCGAHAAISQVLFTARGVESRPAQFVQQFTDDATHHWAHKWNDKDVDPRWIDGDLIYHEGCAVFTGEGDEVKLWDASAGWWVIPQAAGGYGSLLSVRVWGEPEEAYRWNGRTLAANAWAQVD